MATSQERPTIIYVHGSGNQLIKPELKLKWDKALFGMDMGDRTRMAYYVDRSRHPLPESEEQVLNAASAEQGAQPSQTQAQGTASARRTAKLTPAQVRKEVMLHLARVNARTVSQVPPNGTSKSRSKKQSKVAPSKVATEAEIQEWVELYLALDGRTATGANGPKAKGLGDVINMGLAKFMFPDAVDFLLDATWRDRACQAFADEMQSAGPGKKIVIGHSLGTMVALESLNRSAQLSPVTRDVDLWATLGSPLGMAAFRKKMAAWTGSEKLKFPPNVNRWVNMADDYDIAAFQALDLSGVIDYGGHAKTDFQNLNHEGGVFNHCLPDRHRVVGYLDNSKVREVVATATGGAWFKSPLHSKNMSSDLQRLYAANTGARLPVLLELSFDDADTSANLDTARTALLASIEKAVKATQSKLADAEIDPLRHFVAAKLTEEEARFVIAQQAGEVDGAPSPTLKRVWRNASKRALISQSINTLQVQPAHLGYAARGKGITWAVVDTGVSIGHPHFSANKNFQPKQLGWDCTKKGAAVAINVGFIDKDGHGTHVAGIIAGEYEGLYKGVKTSVKGMAPEAKILAYKALDDTGAGNDQWTIKAIEHIEALNERAGRLVVHGVNLSLGGDYDMDAYGCGHTPVCKALRRLWRQGVLVVLAAGNEGFASLATYDGEQRDTNFDMSIGDPANLEEAIAVGSVHKTNPVTYGVSYFSSRGPTADGRRKPDCIAPGERILSANGTASGNSVEELFVEMSGTSMAAPHVSGLLAAFLSVRREYVGEPDRVKQILLANCTDLGRDRYFQGAGLPNLTKMLLNN
jgi:subtilisin family serine protease